MKKIFSLVVFVLAAAGAYGQADSIYIWNKWCSRKDTLLLFNGGNNVIQVYCRGMKPSEYKLKSLDRGLKIGASEVKGDTTAAMAMPYPDKSKTMRMAILNAKTSKVIKTVSFVSDSIPKPVARVGIIPGSMAQKKDLLTQTMLKVVFPNSLYAYPYTIKQYGFRIKKATGDAAFLINGFFLTKEVYQEINDAPVGTECTFTAIKATCPECVMRTLDEVKIRIK